MRPSPKHKELSALPDAERLSRAKQRADRLVDHISTLFVMHETNAIVVYSDRLSSQVPRSYAAHAFNQLQASLHLFEIVRLCALWDGYGSHRQSLPTIVALVNKAEIIDAIAQETYDHFAHRACPVDLTPSDDPDLQEAKRRWRERYRAERAETEAQKVRDRLAFAIC